MKSKGLLIAAAMALVASSLAVAPVQAAPRAAAKTVTVADRDNNTTIDLNVGDTLVVRLASNASTGYTWRIGQNNAKLLAPEGEPKYENSTSGLLGAQGAQVFTFKAVAPGGDALGLLYQKPGLRGVQAAHTFRLRVVINGNEPQPAGKTIMLGDDDNNGNVSAAVGDTIIVKLASNRTTGFSWVVADNVSAILQPEGATYTRNTNRIGGGGTQEFTFKVIAHGEVSLKLAYQRPRGTQVGKAWQVFIESRRHGENPVVSAPAAPVAYVCAGGANFTVAFGDKTAKVTYNGTIKDLPQGEAADGFLYSDGAWELRGTGNAATLTDLATQKPVGDNCTAQPSAAESAPQTILANFACDGGASFAVTFSGDVASVTFNNDTKTLKQQVSADGYRYADDAWELRGVGRNATLTDLKTNAVVAANCAEQTGVSTTPAAGPVTYTCRDNASFTVAFGDKTASVTYKGATQELAQAEAADGFNYSNATWELRGKGAQATLTDLSTKAVVGEGCLDLTKTDAGQNAPRTFTCTDGKTFEVLFGVKIATVTFNGQTEKLEQAEAADGFSYANKAWALRGKGDTATLTDLASNTVVADACAAQATPSASAAPGATVPVTPTAAVTATGTMTATSTVTATATAAVTATSTVTATAKALIGAAFVCAGGANFTVEFDNPRQRVRVTYEGQTRELTQKESADGFAYSDGAWELRGKGNEATLTDLASGKAVATGCKSQ